LNTTINTGSPPDVRIEVTYMKITG